jgi:hypothetical protein
LRIFTERTQIFQGGEVFGQFGCPTESVWNNLAAGMAERTQFREAPGRRG